MECWTDYPKPGQKFDRKLRRVEVVAYDRNKYILTNDGELFKAGYLYRNRRRVPFRAATLERRISSSDTLQEISTTPQPRTP
jgi:hypothetical protein